MSGDKKRNKTKKFDKLIFPITATSNTKLINITDTRLLTTVDVIMACCKIKNNKLVIGKFARLSRRKKVCHAYLPTKELSTNQLSIQCINILLDVVKVSTCFLRLA
jgi:hypothetical protein